TPHPVIWADEVCLTGLAQAPLLPLLVPGHDRVDVGERYLQRHDAEAVALMEDGRGHERRWRTERRGIRFKVHELDKIGVECAPGRAEGPTELRLVVGPGEEMRAELRLLGHGVDDAPGLVIDEKEITVAGLPHDRAQKGMVLRVDVGVSSATGRPGE